MKGRWLDICCDHGEDICPALHCNWVWPPEPELCDHRVMSGEGWRRPPPALDHTGGSGDSRYDPSQIHRYLNMTQHRQRGQLGWDSCLCSPLSWLIREMEHWAARRKTRGKTRTRRGFLRPRLWTDQHATCSLSLSASSTQPAMINYVL